MCFVVVSFWCFLVLTSWKDFKEGIFSAFFLGERCAAFGWNDCVRKQVAPLDWKFPGENFNQKWVTHKMLRPSSVAFSDSFPPRGSLWNRQKLKFQTACNKETSCAHSPELFLLENKIRPSSVQSFALSTFPPRGRLYQRQSFKISNGLQQSVAKRAMPALGGKAICKKNKRLLRKCA